MTGRFVIIGLVLFTGWLGVVYATPLQIQQHDVSLHLKLNTHEIVGVDHLAITPPAMSDATVILNKDFWVLQVLLEGKDIKFKVLKKVDAHDVGLTPTKEDKEYYSHAQGIRFEIPDSLRSKTELTVEIAYRGVMYDTVSTSQFSRTTIKDQTIGIVGNKGVFLTPEGIYYPTVPEGMSVYKMSVALPSPFECVTEGRRTQRIESKDSIWTVWEGMHPSDGINLVAGKYLCRGISPRRYKNIYLFVPIGYCLCLPVCSAYQGIS